MHDWLSSNTAKEVLAIPEYVNKLLAIFKKGACFKPCIALFNLQNNFSSSFSPNRLPL